MNDKYSGKRKIDSASNSQFEINCKKIYNLETNDKFCCSINHLYRSMDCIKHLQYAFQNNQPFESQIVEGLSVNCKPFKHVIFPNFFDNSFLDKIKNDLLNNVEYYKKNNDLYSFNQSKDFKFIHLPSICELRECLIKQVLPLIKFITGFNLHENEIDLTASQYRYTDVLLCHDDQLEERQVAFILYLVQDWNENYGGSLDLFDTDDLKQPKDIVKKIIPKWNQFVFFQVSPQSFHQVSEILTKQNVRLTVHGWFKGPESSVFVEPFIEPILNEIKCGEVDVDEKVFRDWINSKYLEPNIQIQIQNDFSSESSISLPSFLKLEKFQLLCNSMNDYKGWKKVGPPNRKFFEILNEDDCPLVIKEFLKILRSQAMFLTLSNFTGIKLHPLAPENDSSDDEIDDKNSNDDDCSNGSVDSKIKKANQTKIFSPRCSIQIRKWQKGCYTLIHDYDPEVIDGDFKLDVMFYLNHEFKTNRSQGGYISYLSKNENEELSCIEPESNCLFLVYLDPKTVRFIKYLNNLHSHIYHDVSMVFKE